MSFAAKKILNSLSSKLRRCVEPLHDKIARFCAMGFLMETSQLKQSIVELAERTDALRRYL